MSSTSGQKQKWVLPPYEQQQKEESRTRQLPTSRYADDFVVLSNDGIAGVQTSQAGNPRLPGKRAPPRTVRRKDPPHPRQ